MFFLRLSREAPRHDVSRGGQIIPSSLEVAESYHLYLIKITQPLTSLEELRIIPSLRLSRDQNQTIPTSLEYQNHTILTSLEGRNHTISTYLEGQNHTISTSLEGKNHTISVPLIPSLHLSRNSTIPSLLLSRLTTIPSLHLSRFTTIPSLLLSRFTTIPSLHLLRFTTIPFPHLAMGVIKEFIPSGKVIFHLMSFIGDRCVNSKNGLFLQLLIPKEIPTCQYTSIQYSRKYCGCLEIC